MADTLDDVLRHAASLTVGVKLSVSGSMPGKLVVAPLQGTEGRRDFTPGQKLWTQLLDRAGLNNKTEAEVEAPGGIKLRVLLHPPGGGLKKPSMDVTPAA